MMDVYEFSERDDQAYLQSKSSKQKKRKSKHTLTIKTGTTSRKSRNKKNKFNDIDVKNKSELHPPLKLKLIRDQSDPQLFKSIQLITDASQSADFTFEFGQQSLIRCKLSDGREFALNDIVWAKISGYPFWPSKILSLNLSTANQKSMKSCVSKLDLVDEYIACVEWLAYDQISYVNCLNLSNFHSDFITKYSGKIKNKRYLEAVNEAKCLCDENAPSGYHTVDSVQSCETTEADTSSSTMPSHNFTSPESNQSVQSYCCHRPPGTRSHSFSNQSDRSSHSVIIDPVVSVPDSENAHPITSDTNNLSTNWELPDLGSNLDFESNNHIPEFSDDEDDCENIDIAKIEFMIDETHKMSNT